MSRRKSGKWSEQHQFGKQCLASGTTLQFINPGIAGRLCDDRKGKILSLLVVTEKKSQKDGGEILVEGEPIRKRSGLMTSDTYIPIPIS